MHQGAEIAISEAIQALPEAAGFGNMYNSLHEAMQRDSTGELQALVEAFTQAGTAARRQDFAEKILQVWAGTAEIHPLSRGGAIDARHVWRRWKNSGDKAPAAKSIRPLCGWR